MWSIVRFFQLHHDKYNEAQSSCYDLRNNDHPFFRIKDQTKQGERNPNKSHDNPENLIELLAPRVVITHAINPPLMQGGVGRPGWGGNDYFFLGSNPIRSKGLTTLVVILRK